MKKSLTFLVLFTSSLLISCSSENLLIRATYNGDLNKVKKLVEKGAKVDYNEIFDETPLMNAAVIGNYEIVEYLVTKGANVNYQKQGFKLKSSEQVGTQYNFYINEVPHGGHTSLTLALYGHGDFEKVILLLLEKGAKVNYQFIQKNAEPTNRQSNIVSGIETGGPGTSNFAPTGENVETPLTNAIKNYRHFFEKGATDFAQKYKSIIELLLKYGADKNAVDGNGENALQISNKYNLTEIIAILK
jgi:ankyrin repeat protein